jgi:hypothetical protein
MKEDDSGSRKRLCARLQSTDILNEICQPLGRVATP